MAFLNDLNDATPAEGSPVSNGAGLIREIKNALLTTFPGWTAAMTAFGRSIAQAADAAAARTLLGLGTAAVAAAADFVLKANNGSDFANLVTTRTNLDAEPFGVTAIAAKTGAHTLELTDKGKLITMTVAAANDLSVPANATVPFPIGTRIDGAQLGAGRTTIVALGGVTIRNRNGLLSGGQYAAFHLRKIGTDEWLAAGDLDTV